MKNMRFLVVFLLIAGATGTIQGSSGGDNAKQWIVTKKPIYEDPKCGPKCQEEKEKEKAEKTEYEKKQQANKKQ